MRFTTSSSACVADAWLAIQKVSECWAIEVSLASPWKFHVVWPIFSAYLPVPINLPWQLIYDCALSTRETSSIILCEKDLILSPPLPLSLKKKKKEDWIVSAANIDTTKQALSSLNPRQQISLVMDPIFRRQPPSCWTRPLRTKR